MLLPTTALADHHEEAIAATQDLQGAGFYRFKIGDIEAAVLGDGLGALPGAAFATNRETGDIDAYLQAQFLPTDRVPTHFLAMALKMPTGEVVLIDTGTGAPVGGDDPTPRLIRHLQRFGVEPGDERALRVLPVALGPTVDEDLVSLARDDVVGGLVHATHRAHDDAVVAGRGDRSAE
ncbi:MAG: hypothetical protein AAGK78_10730, partial [Planctomycetota bacterium]